MLITISLLLTLLSGEILDCLAAPKRRTFFSGGWRALLLRATAVLSIWLLAFGLTGRALFAMTATIVTIAILVTISKIKQRFLREPLLFSDFALLQHVLWHPGLFYIPRRWHGAVLGGIAILIAAIVAWLLIEPSAGGQAQVLAATLLGAGVIAVALRPSAPAWAARLVDQPNPDADLARLGLLASLLAYFAAWRREGDVEPARATLMKLPSPPRYDAIVILQAESFVDLRRLGRDDVQLPTFDRLRKRALSTGLLEVPCEGAYTLRPESAVISGVGFSEQGLDRFHPYLRPHRLAAGALPRLLSNAGWDTLFVHPYDGAFFRRAQAIQALGFARFADQRAFAGARRVGPYIGDEAVADFLLAQIRERRAGGRRLFAYAVTMEAHDPYGPGRIAGEDDPIRQHIHHIENADRMLARLASELDGSGQRVLLVLFGDHVPFLPTFADPFPDARTDYVVVELGRNAMRDRVDFEVTRPEHLHALIAQRLATTSAPERARQSDQVSFAS